MPRRLEEKPELRTVVCLAAVLALTVAAIPIVGLVAAPAGLAVMAVVWLHSPRAGAVALGLMGGLIATYSAAGALVLASGTPPYDARQGLGWLALGLALLGAGAALLSGRRPRAAGAAMVAAALIGFGAINLFYINTWYGLGAALLAAAGFWALAARGS